MVEFNCQEEFEQSKKTTTKKPEQAKSGIKRVVTNTRNKKTTIVSDDKELKIECDAGNMITKNSNTKGKKEKVGKMCQICGQIFKSLQAHLYVHDIYPKFECNICNKKFRHKANVLSHMKIHTNQR